MTVRRMLPHLFNILQPANAAQSARIKKGGILSAKISVFQRPKEKRLAGRGTTLMARIKRTE
jgi:hypothetical protein